MSGRARNSACSAARPDFSVLRHPSTVVVHRTEVGLRFSVALIGSLAVPNDRLGVVLRYPLAIFVHSTEGVLGTSLALVGSFTVPIDGLGVALRYPVAVMVRQAED